MACNYLPAPRTEELSDATDPAQCVLLRAVDLRAACGADHRQHTLIEPHRVRDLAKVVTAHTAPILILVFRVGRRNGFTPLPATGAEEEADVCSL